MASSGKRRKKSGSGCGRALVLVFIMLLFAGAAFLLTSTGHEPSNNKPAPARTTDTDVSRDRPSPPAASRPSAIPETPVAEPVEPPRREQRPSETPPPPPRPDHSWDHREFARGDKDSPNIALTFDAGASAAPTPAILETLSKHNARATFFLTGSWMKKNPDLTRRIAREGHEIGNHTYSHKRLTDLNAGDIAEEARKTEELALELTGLSTKPLLRVPYGARNKRVLAALEEQGYRSIYWDIDSWDSVKEGIKPDEIRQRILLKVRNGSIVLLHCGSHATAQALDLLLSELKAAGYRQVTVSELLQL